jgi:NADPH:quinone reductase-like Zn-dependent oxidoreductase
MQVIENDLRLPSPGEARVKILATQVCAPDVTCRYGTTPFAPRVPFVPGYAIVGIVGALGPPKLGVHTAAQGDRVGALSVFGGYAEYIYLRQRDLIPTPASLDPAEAVTLVLNYLVAYQTLHRVNHLGDKILIVGASGASHSVCSLADWQGSRCTALPPEASTPSWLSMGRRRSTTVRKILWL